MTEQKLFKSRYDYRLKGGIAMRCDRPFPDPFVDQDAQAERLVEDFLTRWEGPSELQIPPNPKGFLRSPLRYPISKLWIRPAPSGDYAYLVCGGGGRLLKLPARLELLPSLDEAEYVTPARWHPDGTILAIGAKPRSLNVPNEVVLIDVAEAQIIRRIPLGKDSYCYDLAWSPEGHMLAILAGRYREDTGLSRWISDKVYGGAHGTSIRDFRLELHAPDGSGQQVIPLAEGVEGSSEERLVWRTVPQLGQ